MIDLHIHSTASDGSFSPRQILALAHAAGVRAISLTDHDSIAGIQEILTHISHLPIEFVTGVEISCEPPDTFKRIGSVHLLGYGFSVYDRQLNQVLKQKKENKILRKLKKNYKNGVYG
mgnify:CR=1 FL=1